MARKMIDPKPVLRPDALYMGDNGRMFCGRHAGCSALYTGRDISGQPVLRLSAADQETLRADLADIIPASAPLCEECREIGGAA